MGLPASELKDDKRAAMRVHGRTGKECPECGDVVREVGTVRRAAPSGGTYVIRDFLLATDPGASPTAGDDAADAAWFSPEELPVLETSPGLVDAFVEWGLVRPSE